MKILKFLNLYPNEGTTRVYRAGIYDFFDCLYGKVRKGKQVSEDEKAVYGEKPFLYSLWYMLYLGRFDGEGGY